MRPLLALIIVATVSLCTVAEENSYWILGSYSSESAARLEAERLSQVLDAPVSVRFTPPLAVHRVLLPSHLVDAETLAVRDIDAWLLILGHEADLPVEPVEPAAPEDRPVIPAPGIEPAGWPPLYPPFSPGESLDEYCTRQPESALCTDPEAQALIERAQRIRRARERLSGACAQITNPDHQQTCEQLQ